jgi:hypothetical protein
MWNAVVRANCTRERETTSIANLVCGKGASEANPTVTDAQRSKSGAL